jgi:hypothetical protein
MTCISEWPAFSHREQQPQAWEVAYAKANGRPTTNFDPAKETVAVLWPKSGGSVLLEVHFSKKKSNA